MENVNKHCLVLVKYIKRQRNLSKKSKKRHQIVPIKLKKKKKKQKKDINEKKKQKFCQKKVKNIVVNGHTTQPRRMLTSTKRCWLSAKKTKKICQKK